MIYSKLMLLHQILYLYYIMQKKSQCVLEINRIKIGQKNFRIPELEISKVSQYFQIKIPKQTKEYKKRKFYAPQELKAMESKLTCGIKKPKFQQKSTKTNVEPANKVTVQQNINKQESISVGEIKKQEVKVQILKQIKPRPPLNKEGPTHFIMIPMVKELAQTYTNFLVPSIQQQLVEKQYLHITLLTFRLKQQAQLNEWNSILKLQKKKKIRVKGIGMVGEKNRYARRLYLNVNGLDDLIDSITLKAIQRNLITQKQISGQIKFDKKTQTYKLQRPHITILRTGGKDLVDVQNYLKTLKDVGCPQTTINQIRISVIGSFKSNEGFYDESIIRL